jgi:uroporphyrinogen decarboxylase
MNSRERVAAAIHHEKPDRVPFDLGSTDVTGIQAGAYARLCTALGMVETPVMLDPLQGLVQISDAMRTRLAIDTVGVWLNPTLRSCGDCQVVDEWGTMWRRPEHGAWYEPIAFPLAHVQADDLGGYRFPDPADPAKLAGIADRAAQAFEHTEYAVVANFSGALLARGQLVRGPAQFLMDLLAEPEFAAEILDRILAYNIQLVESFLNRVGDKIQVIKVSDDIGAQDNLLISPALYRRIIKPRQAKFFAAIHAKTSARLLYHSCGAVSRLIDDWIEIGVDILNPIQVSARGMDTAALGTKYAGKVSFWGAVDNQGAISQGTADAVRADVCKCIGDLAKQGGYVLASSHNLGPDTPVGNILALCQTERSPCG